MSQNKVLFGNGSITIIAMGLPLYQGYQWMILQLFGSISKWFAFPLCLVEEVHHNIKRGL
jgi:hypothetical protein